MIVYRHTCFFPSPAYFRFDFMAYGITDTDLRQRRALLEYATRGFCGLLSDKNIEN